MRYLQLTLIFSLVIGITSAGRGRLPAKYDITGIDSSRIRFTYDLLNDYLAPRLNAGDLVGSCQRIVGQLYEKNLKSDHDLNTDHMKSLRLLLALIDTNNDQNSRCTSSSAEILRLNDLATRGRARTTFAGENGQKVRPLDLIVGELSQNHVSKCREVYAQRCLKISASLSERVLAQLRILVDEYVTLVAKHQTFSITDISLQRGSNEAERFFALAKRLHEMEAKKERLMEAKEVVESLYGVLHKLTAGEPDELSLQPIDSQAFDKTKFDSVLRKRMLDPCRLFTGALGNTFELARLDAERSDEYQADGSLVDFYRSWVTFELCKKLHAEESAMRRKLVKLASEQPPASGESESR